MKVNLFPPACLFLFSLSASADVIDVGGPNPDAISIGAASQLAVSGDVIRVYPGQYESFTIDGKSLSVVGVDSADVQVAGVVRVLNLGSTQSVELKGLVRVAPNPLKLIVQDCQGSVRVEGCVLYNSNITPFGSWDSAVEVSNSSGVAFVGCQLTGIDRGWDPHGLWHGDNGVRGLVVTDSSVAVYDSRIRGGNGESRTGGGGPFGSTSYGGNGGSAILLFGMGNFFVAGSHLQGGSGGWGDGFQGWDGTDGSGISCSANYSVQTLHTNVSLTSANQITRISMAPGATLDEMMGNATLLDGPRMLRDTDSLGLTVHAEVGARVGVAFSIGHANFFAGASGPLLVQVPSGPLYQSMLYLGSVGGTGYVQVSIPMRDIPHLSHTRLHLMALSVSNLGRRYSNPVTPLLLDAAW